MVDVKDEGIDLEAAIDDQIMESNALARKQIVEQLEDVLMNQSVVLIKSPGDSWISLKTDSGATVTFKGVLGSLEVSISYNRKSTI